MVERFLSPVENESRTARSAGLFRAPDKSGIKNNSKIIFVLFLNENICCDPSLELSSQDGSNLGSQHVFME